MWNFPANRHCGLQSRRGEKRELENQTRMRMRMMTKTWTYPMWKGTSVMTTLSGRSTMFAHPGRPDDQDCVDENTWERLDQHLVVWGENAEIARFKKTGVHSCVRRSEDANDPDGTSVKVKWVRTNSGTVEQPNVRCWLVSQQMDGPSFDDNEDGTRSCSQWRARDYGHGCEECFPLRRLSPPHLR